MPKILSAANVEEFRDRLCDAAERLFAAHGSDGMTMRELAQALSVSQMTPYRYFKDKDAILAAVRARAFNRFAAAMEGSARTRSGQAAKRYVDFALGNPQAYRLMFDTSQPTFARYPELVAAMERARLTMGAGLRLLAEQGRFKGDVTLTAHIFWSVLHGAVMLELVGMLRPGKLGARKIARSAVAAVARQVGVNVT